MPSQSRKGAPRGLATWSPERRFWRNVLKTDGCWLWQGATNDDGYGHLTEGGRRIYAHRFSYRLHFGELDPSLAICHRCDVPACVRPDHLFAGTLADNNQDMWSKGRGVANPVWLMHQRLSDEDRTDIVRRFASGEPTSDIAEAFGVTRQYVGQIAARNGITRDGARPLKTHCKRGHEFTDANTYIGKEGDRVCRACRAERARGYVRAKSE
jgi:hypothetical protein